MPDLPISGLPAITVPSSSYLLAAVSQSVTAQMTIAQVAAAISSSFTASYYNEVDPVFVAKSASLATTGSNTFIGTEVITGSLSLSGSVAITGSSTMTGGFKIANFTGFGDPASLQFRTYHDDATTDGAWYSWGTEFLQMGPINSGTDATYTMALVPADNSTGYIPVDRPSLLFNADSQIYLNGSKNFRIYSPSTGKTFTVGNMATVLSGSLTVSGSVTQNNVISSLVKADSSGMLTAATGGVDYIAPAYLSAWHSASLAVTAVHTPCTMSFSTTDFSYGGIIISGSYADKIKFTTGGIYNIQFSAQTNKTTGTSSDLNIWLAKNGTEVDNSNTGVTLAGGANDVAIPAWNFFVSASAGDYYQLMFAASLTNTFIQYLPSGSAAAAGPAIPSVILTVNRIA